MRENIRIELLHKDKRGSLYRMQFHGRTFELIELVEDALRGGHFHDSEVTLLVLYGQVLYQEIIPNVLDSERIITLKTGDIHKIPAGTAHLLIGIEDSLAIEFHDGEYSTTNYVPYRKKVEEYLQ